MLISLHITHSSTGGMTCLGDIIPGLNDALVKELAENGYVDEYVIIRTCNRLEAYIATKNNRVMKAALDGLVRKNVPFSDRQVWYILEDKECIKHLFTVICGIDSLIVGEDQIQHQTKDAFTAAQNEGHVGKVLYSLFNNAIIVGKRVRTETDLNKGAVSVGYAAIELAQSKIGTLEGKDIAIIGAGDMAGVIAKNLVGKGPKTVVVSNRTFNRAQELAKELEGTAIGFDRLQEIIHKSDLVLVATSAKHDILDKENVGEAMKGREDKPLLIIDVSVPTNVNENVNELPSVSMHTMASLDSIAAENVARRKNEIASAERIIREELRRVEEEEKTETADLVIRKMSLDDMVIRTVGRRKVIREMEFVHMGAADYEWHTKPSNESAGTIRLLSVLAVLYQSMYEGKTYVIDNLDQQLNAASFRDLLKYYCEFEGNGQLIYTTNSLMTMNQQEMTRMDEVCLLEKKEGSTQTIPLDGFPNIKSMLSLERNYLDGRFGGRPGIITVDVPEDFAE